MIGVVFSRILGSDRCRDLQGIPKAFGIRLLATIDLYE